MEIVLVVERYLKETYTKESLLRFMKFNKFLGNITNQYLKPNK